MEKIIQSITDKIYKQKTYPTVSYKSREQVEDIVRYYMTLVDQYSKTTMSNRYFSEAPLERTKFLGDEWIRAIYQKVAGAIPVKMIMPVTMKEYYVPAKDYNLRDRIWFTLNLIRDYAKEDAYYMPVWQFFKFKDAPAKAKAIVAKIEQPIAKPTGQQQIIDPAKKPLLSPQVKKYAPIMALGLLVAKVMKVI